MRTTRNTLRLLRALAPAALMICIFSPEATAQRRDYLTESEIELVREAQQIDLRIGVLVTAAERRFAAIDGTKFVVKNESEWGPAPKGSRMELTLDIDGLTQKAVDDIDDVASRNADSEFFPKAVRKLASSCEKFAPKIKSLLDSAKDDKERGVLTRISDRCGDVIASVARLPQDAKAKPAKKP